MDDTDRRLQALDDEILADAQVLHEMVRRPEPEVETEEVKTLLALLSSATGRLEQSVEDAEPQQTS